MDLTDIANIKKYLAAVGWRPGHGKRFGQNFLVNPEVIEHTIRALALTPDDTVLEIGPGLGVLTVVLAKHAGRVVAIEKDTQLIPVLKKNLSGLSNVTIISTDALTVDPASYKLRATSYVLAGNLAYSLAIPVIERFILDSAYAPTRAVFLIQKEVAERLASPPGGSARSAITVLLEAAAHCEIIAVVPRTDFYPEPDVDGAIIRITPRQSPKFQILNPTFSNFVFRLFRQRRKQLVNSLRGVLPRAEHAGIPEALKSLRINPKARPQELSLSQWQVLFGHFRSK